MIYIIDTPTRYSEILSVSCVSCYVKGLARATLTVSPDFNISSALETLTEEFVNEIGNITDTVWNTFENWTEAVFQNTSDTIGYDVEACTIDISSGHCTSFFALAFYPTWLVLIHFQR